MSTTVEYVVYDPETGRVIGYGSGAFPYELNTPIAGRVRTDRDLIGQGRPETHRVDVSDPENHQLLERERVPGLPETLTAEAGGEVEVAPDLPACTVSWSGPMTGSAEHPGGSLMIGFTIPGDYTLAADPFPWLPFSLSLEVTS